MNIRHKGDSGGVGRLVAALALSAMMHALVCTCFATTLTPDGAADMTTRVRTAVEALPDGGVLAFAPGVYHFYGEGCAKMRLYPSNNTAGDKKVLFPIVGKRNVTIDAGGATFMLHGKLTPFVATNSTGVTVRNLTMNTFYPQVAEFAVTEKRDDGFLVKFAENVCTYRITPDGGMVFETEGEATPTCDRRLSLHALKECKIHYLFAGNTTASTDNLATSFVRVNAEKVGEREVFFRYRECAHKKCVKCPFDIGDPLVVNLAENRDRMAFFFENCRDVAVENVTLNRGAGMGVVAQMCENVSVRGLKVVPLSGDNCSITADGIQMINCGGKAVIEGCEISDALDDPVNIHGNYLSIAKTDGKIACVRAMHDQHRGVFPYRPGDTVEFSVPRTREVLGSAHVVAVERDSSDEYAARLVTDSDLSSYPAGTLVENVTLNPDVTMRNNHFHDFTHILVAGRGKILVEGNRFERFVAGISSTDSAGYWYESGRLSEMIVRNNAFSDCNSRGGFYCVGVKMTGWEPGDPNAPKINGRVVLEDNRFEGVRYPETRVVMTGVRSFSEVENNRRDAESQRGVK